MAQSDFSSQDSSETQREGSKTVNNEKISAVKPSSKINQSEQKYLGAADVEAANSYGSSESYSKEYDSARYIKKSGELTLPKTVTCN